MIRKILLGVLVLLAAVTALGFYKTLKVPGDLWITTQAFAACPARPSCVSSVATDEGHRIEPLRYEGDAAQARARLEEVIRAMPLTRIDHATPEYLHVVFQTPTMHYHDDVELLVQEGGTIQARSISRFGYGDHGVNRTRIERIREAFGR